jgi:hypothetical protein
MSAGCQETHVDNAGAVADQQEPITKKDKTQVPYESREFSFDYSNNTDETVWVDSVRVLNRLVNMHRVWANGEGAGISKSRNDCTPEALLNTQADFLWWKMDDPFDSKSAQRRPKDPTKSFRSSMLFPWLDVEADRWRCYFTLQNDKTWVGRFEGVVLKPIGAKPDILKRSKLEGNNQWIQFQFCNLTDKEICFLKPDGKLLGTNSETLLYIPNIPADKSFHGFAAHSHEGSIYRPVPGGRVELVWCIPAYKLKTGDETRTRTQTINLPNFDPKIDNWYCYFTLNPDNKWTATFEGGKQKH